MYNWIAIEYNKRTGKDVMYVRDEAYDCNGKIVKESNALMLYVSIASMPGSWEIIRELEVEFFLNMSEVRVCKECGSIEWNRFECRSCSEPNEPESYIITSCTREDLETKPTPWNKESGRVLVYYK